MPQAQVIDLSPIPRTKKTALEKTLEGFSNQYRQNQVNQQDADALADIYRQHQDDGDNLTATIKDIQTRRGMSPTARVTAIKQLTDFNEYNGKLQAQSKKDADDAAKKAKESSDNKAIIADLEKRRGLAPGSLSAYESDPKMAESITKPAATTQASKPIDNDQLTRIQHVEGRPEYSQANLAQKGKMLRDSGVSKENIDSIIDQYKEDQKLGSERASTIGKKQAESDFAFYEEEVSKIPSLFNREKTLEAANVLNEEGVTGKNWDQAMQAAGLLQYTSDGFRQFSSYAKEMVKNQNIKSIIGSQISQMEFGFFRDATISERFSKEANRQIIKKENLALRYEKLYADITKSIVDQNEGQIPPNLQAEVNAEFSKQSHKISKEVQEAAIDFDAIQNIPEGKVLMFDKKRRPLHVPANEVKKYTKAGASLS